MVVNYKSYALFDYEQSKQTKNDTYILGHVVIKNSDSEIGVIIQRHGGDEYRADNFGNCSGSEIRLATKDEVKTLRSEILNN